MAKDMGLGLRIYLQTTEADIKKQVNEVQAKVKQSIKLKVSLDTKASDLNAEIKKLSDVKNISDLKVKIKIDNKAGYINDQIKALSDKITQSITVKLKLDARDVEIQTRQVRQQIQQVQQNQGVSQNSSMSNASTSPIIRSSWKPNTASTLNATQTDIQKSVLQALNVSAGQISAIKAELNKDFGLTKALVSYKDNAGIAVKETLVLKDAVNSLGEKIQVVERIKTTTSQDFKKSREEAEKLRISVKALENTLSQIKEGKYQDFLPEAGVKKVEASIKSLKNNIIGTKEAIQQAQHELTVLNSNAKDASAESSFKNKLAARKKMFVDTGTEVLKHYGATTLGVEKSIAEYMDKAYKGREYTFNQRLKTTPSSLGGVSGGAISTTTVRMFNKATKEVEMFDVAVDHVTNQIVRFQTVTRQASNNDLGFGGQLQNAAKAFPIWMIAATAWMQTINALRDGIKYVVDMDNAMTDLAKVTDLNTQQMEGLRQTALETGKEMGKSSADIMKSYAEIARVHKNPEDIAELGRVSTMASNVTSMTAEQASKAIGTAMLTFKLGVGEAKGLLDQWNEIQNNYRTSAEDLSSSIEKVGAAAKLAGVSVQQLEGYTTALVSSTGITGDEAGTAIKSMISRTFRIGVEGEEDAGKSEALLSSLGIAVRDIGGQFRSFDDIMKDVSKNWSSWGNITQQNLAQTIGGKHMCHSIQ